MFNPDMFNPDFEKMGRERYAASKKLYDEWPEYGISLFVVLEPPSETTTPVSWAKSSYTGTDVRLLKLSFPSKDQVSLTESAVLLNVKYNLPSRIVEEKLLIPWRMVVMVEPVTKTEHDEMIEIKRIKKASEDGASKLIEVGNVK